MMCATGPSVPDGRLLYGRPELERTEGLRPDELVGHLERQVLLLERLLDAHHPTLERDDRLRRGRAEAAVRLAGILVGLVVAGCVPLEEVLRLEDERTRVALPERLRQLERSRRLVQLGDQPLSVCRR